MAEEQKKSWKQRFGIGAIVGGLLFGGATHKDEIKDFVTGENNNKSSVTIGKGNVSRKIGNITESSNELNLIFIYHNSFLNNSFYKDAAKIGFKGFEGDFQFILDTIQLEKISDNDVKQLVKTLEFIIKQSKELNSKYKYLKSINSTEILDLDEKIEFYKQFEKRNDFANYVSAIQNIIKKNPNYSKYGDGTLMYVTNLHAFVGIRKN